MQLSYTKNTTVGWLQNTECGSFLYPQRCPNSWQYVDENNKWSFDTELSVKCGKFQNT